MNNEQPNTNAELTNEDLEQAAGGTSRLAPIKGGGFGDVTIQPVPLPGIEPIICFPMPQDPTTI